MKLVPETCRITFAVLYDNSCKLFSFMFIQLTEVEVIRFYFHVLTGTFAVACLMVGSAVTKGYNSVLAQAGTTVVDLGPLTNDTNGTTAFSDTMEEEVMGEEELNIRLQFAMSVTFMVGVIQVC